MDVCCLLEGRWRGHGSRMLGVEGRRCHLWWFENGDVVGYLTVVMVKEELCEKVVEVRRVCDRVMAVVLVFEEDVLKFNYGYAPQIYFSVSYYEGEAV